MVLKSINPFSDEVIAEYEEESLEEIREKIARIKSERIKWASDLDRRKEALRNVKSRFESSLTELSKIISLEMGKSIEQSENEVRKCINLLEYYINNVDQMLKPEQIRTEAKKSYVRFDPIGVVLLIMPWNFPAWQVMRAAVPALIAGNGIILKHASNVSGTSLKLQEILDLDVFKTTVTRAINAISSIKYVDGVSFTGSTEAGSKIASEAGRELKKIVLELGGSDPFIVLKSADIEKAVKDAVFGRLQNNGQSCIASKRIIVHESLYDEFFNRLKEKFEEVSVGNPLERRTFLGPLSTLDQKRVVLSQLDALKIAGEVFKTNVEETGNFMAPTIVKTQARFDQEVFGPVAILKKFDSERQAIDLANETPFGLGSAIYGEEEEAERMAPYIDAGMVFVNKNVTSDPRLPFGGVKKSGIGRELSKYGLLEFTNIKSVWID